jgi:hypothetical protein
VRTSFLQEQLCCSRRDGELNLKHTEDGGAHRTGKGCTLLTEQPLPSSVAERSSREASQGSAAVRWETCYQVKR